MKNEKKCMRVNYNVRKLNKKFLPILVVRSSCKNFYAQLFDSDEILLDVSSLNCKDAFKDNIKTYNTNGVIELAKICATRMNDLNIDKYVFNRGSKRYIGKIKIFGDTLKKYLGGTNE